MAHIVVLGAGLGGTIMAYELRDGLAGEHQVSVVNNGSHYSFVPSNPWVAVGWRDRQAVEIDLAPVLARRKIGFHPQGARRVHPVERTVELNDGSSVSYDYLVIATGPELAFDEIEGLGPEHNTQSVCHIDHAVLRTEPQQGDVALNLLPKADRARSSHEIALDVRQRIATIPVPQGTSLKVVEPPPGPPVMATLLAEIYGPDGDTRRKVAARIEAAFRSVPFIVDVDNSWGQPARRLRATISTDDAEFFHGRWSRCSSRLPWQQSGYSSGRFPGFWSIG